MDPETRRRMGEQAVALARACDYHTTGTCEFLMDINKDFYFLEMNTRLQVEHPITEEITGVDLVEQQILTAAGHPLTLKQSDIRINGHATEYRVYAEDPSRKFLPSIGFLTKYLEPKPHQDMRIDTGVQEGSEISMYYDPMISKLITWGKDRETSMRLLGEKLDEYVVHGVDHNIGFGKSIIENEAYWKGNYSTAFIPTYYKDGYHGEELTNHRKHSIALAAFKMRNISTSQNVLASGLASPESLLYVSIAGAEKNHDFKVEHQGNGKFEVTDLETGETQTHSLDKFDYQHNSLIELREGDSKTMLQLVSQKNNLNFNFYLRGNKVKTTVYDATQYKYKSFMKVPEKIDTAKMVMSPMPGTVVSIAVSVGDTVVDGQDLCVIEAMKMQNLIKSQRDGKIKSLNVKPGDSVAVDQLIIEFE